MSIADNISRINNAKISMIEAIQSNIDIDLPSGLRIHELAPYITSACQVRYQAGVIAGGGSSSSGGEVEEGLVATGGTGDYAFLNGSWTEAGTTTVQGVTAPYYSMTSNGSTYYLTRVKYSYNYETNEGIAWFITDTDIHGSASNYESYYSYNIEELGIAYSISSNASPVGLTFSKGYIHKPDSAPDVGSGNVPVFSGGESASSSSGGAEEGLVATGGTGDFANLNGSWEEAGTTTVAGVTAPYYSKTVGNNTYYLTRANSLYNGGIVWAITDYNLSGEADEWYPSLSEAAMAYVSSSAAFPEGLTFTAGNTSGTPPSFVSGGTILLSGLSNNDLNGEWTEI